MKWIILSVTLLLLLQRSTHVLICTVKYNHVQLSVVELSIHRYYRSKINLPKPSQVQLSPNVLREVNHAVTAVLECEELGNLASKVKSESTTRLSWLRIRLLLEGVASPLGNSQLLQSQCGLYSVICNGLTVYSKVCCISTLCLVVVCMLPVCCILCFVYGIA